ncbi:DUF3305 domain-containing protein [Paracoccus tegillarcae]|uniref:DUF3305 domain-containing protein n=2 Tax=Paracoccus tegillarcae TaxID=1529068 RepID=A0A2K9EEQ4_9RHOB|nr:DUF3305 domain-containing protein [Paracoccus tegillarcae]
MPVGIVVRRSPGVTRWAKWAWRIVAIIPGAGPADWRELRRDGEVVDYHAATLTLEIYSSDTEGYLATLAGQQPGVTVVMHPETAPDAQMPWRVSHVTASAYDGQDYGDSGEAMLEIVAMPPAMIGWLQNFVDAHHVDEPFIKRRRDRLRIDRNEDGKGDARIRQMADVYRAPRTGSVP